MVATDLKDILPIETLRKYFFKILTGANLNISTYIKLQIREVTV